MSSVRFIALLCIKAVLFIRISATEDVFLAEEIGMLSGMEISHYMEPDIITPSETNGEQYDFFTTKLDSKIQGKHKKPKRMILERIKNHNHRHASTDDEADDGLTEPVSHQSITSFNLVDDCQRGLSVGDWNETECITCQCLSSQVKCHQQECPELDCEQIVDVEGECCPKCPEKLCETPDGRRFKDGDEWHKDDCTFCECEKGEVLCSVEDCQVPLCKDPIKIPGRCCPACLDASCLATNGTQITSEGVWKEGSCTHCYCYGGAKRCDEERCPHINCTEKHIPPGKCCEKCNEGVVDCVVSNWGSWSECPIQECGGGMSRRFRSAVIENKNGGNFCPHMSEATICPKLPCDDLPVCPVTEWSSWGHCTATCGNGYMMRSREKTKVTKATMTSLIDCSETHFEETKQCNVGNCAEVNVLTGGEDSLIHGDICFQTTWSDWGPCSSECGGQQERRQVLLNQKHPRGHLCHLLRQVRVCECNINRSKNTAIKCKVSPWSEWSPCSKTCGAGSTRTKTRRILIHPSGGAQCPRLRMTKPCRPKQCAAPSESHSFRDDCLTDDGVFKFNGEVWSENNCATCSCRRSQIRCHNAECER